MRGWNFLVDVIDNSMSPKMIAGDFVTVFPGFKIEDGRTVAVMVTNAAEKTTKLLIRKVVMEEQCIILKALDWNFPSFVYEGPESESVQIVGLVTNLHRYFDKNGKVYGPIVTAERAKKNRIVLEQNIGNITYEKEEV